jgi:hypothetical protein
MATGPPRYTSKMAMHISGRINWKTGELYDFMTNPVISPKSGVDEDPKILGFGFYGWIFLVGRGLPSLV